MLSPGTLADRVAVASARTVTRRRLLRNAGAAALGASLGLAMAGTEDVGVAFADGSASHPCGPSPIAPSGYCATGTNCGPPSACGGRYHDTYTCNGQFAGGCWNEDYRSQGKGLWSCCDVCINSGTGPACSGNCNSYAKRAAICRTRIG